MKIQIITRRMFDGCYRGYLQFEIQGVKNTREITGDCQSANEARHQAENILRETIRESHSQRNLTPAK